MTCCAVRWTLVIMWSNTQWKKERRRKKPRSRLGRRTSVFPKKKSVYIYINVDQLHWFLAIWFHTLEGVFFPSRHSGVTIPLEIKMCSQSEVCLCVSSTPQMSQLCLHRLRKTLRWSVWVKSENILNTSDKKALLCTHIKINMIYYWALLGT